MGVVDLAPNWWRSRSFEYTTPKGGKRSFLLVQKVFVHSKDRREVPIKELSMFRRELL
jgi:hypothetical protein